MKIYNAIIQLYCQCFNKPVNGYSSVCTRNHTLYIPSECTLSLLLLRGTESFVDSNMAKDNFCKLYNPWKPDKENCPNGSLTPLSCLCEL